MDMLKHDPMYDESSAKPANACSSFPSWDREALILKIQNTDSCGHREAGRQVDEMAQCLIRLLKAPPTAAVYVRHRADCSRIFRWLPPNHLIAVRVPRQA
jgi:hypothetical protein